jgi:hypothetical protein
VTGSNRSLIITLELIFINVILLLANVTNSLITMLNLMVPISESSIHEEIKSRLNLGNACYCSVQNLLSSHLFYRNLKD